MGFLDDLFKQKPGGTTVGNILRDVTKTLTGGNFGTGTMKQTQEQADNLKLTDAEFQLKYGKTKGGVLLPTPSIGAVFTGVTAGVQSATVWAVMKKYWYYFLIPVVVLFALGYFINKSRKQNSFKRKR